VRVQETGAPDDFNSLSLIQPEVDQIRYMELSNVFSVIAGLHRFSAGVTHLVGLYLPAKNFAEAAGFALSATGDGFSTLAGYMSFLDHRSSQLAAWQRRRDDWVQQSKITAEEIRQIDKQIAALKIKKCITEKELVNHRKQIVHASNIDDYLRHLKFSCESLYAWTEDQLAGLYFTAYQMAYELAKRAERAFRFELGVGEETASFVRFGHWDNLRKGLLSGERLSQDLRRLEAAYLDKNRRDFEITKHVSLRQLNPFALIRFQQTGECEFNVPEALFDLDFPGHYFRRIKSVSISLPCVVGPYSSVSAMLTLLSSKLREKSNSDEENLRSSHLPTQSIATSTGQNDAGVFELNFRDERYLPFEGAGVISSWRLELPKEFRQFDYRTISDVVLHLRYTARDGGSGFKSTIENKTRDLLNEMVLEAERTGLFQVIDLRYQFPGQWTRLKQSNSTELTLGAENLPFFVKKHTPAIDEVIWVALASGNEAVYEMSVNTDRLELRRDRNTEDVYVGTSNNIVLGTKFTLSASDNRKLEDLTALIRFRITA
jgi:hypothetical protein